MLLKDPPTSAAPDIQARMADARAAIAMVVAPLVANAVAVHREALSAQTWPDDFHEFDRAFRQWQTETGAGGLRDALEELRLLIWDADWPAGVELPSPVGDPLVNTRFAHVHGGTCP